MAALALAAGPALAAPGDYAKRAYNILPPGESGSIPARPTSRDQLRLYDRLTPLRGDVSARDIRRNFKSAAFGTPDMAGRREATGRPGLTLIRDRWDVPHVFGKTRPDVMFGAGWATAEDRGAFIEIIRGPSRIAALDIPGVSAITVASSLRQFVPSSQTERFLAAERARIVRLGPKGRQLIADARDFVAGLNAYYRSIGSPVKPWSTNDVISVASFIGAVFGKGGGDEVRSAELLSALQARLGAEAGRAVWGDLRSVNDPEAPATVRRPFPYAPAPTGATPGSAVVDAGSISAAALDAAVASAAERRPMSNALVVGRSRSATGHPLAVMGPQVGYFYPQFLMELDLHGGGIDARGAAFPGVSLYVLLGRGKDYAWSATSSGSDNIDQYLEELCNPDGTPATRASTAYVYRGTCRPMSTFDAGTLKRSGTEAERRLIFRQTVHGPVSGTVTVAGKPYAVTSRRSTRGRDAVSGIAFAALNENRVHSAKDFARVMNQVEFTFNWFYADDRDIAFFSSGRLPVRAAGVDPSLPTLGTGAYEWRGFLPRAAHPQAINPPSGLLLNWNNRTAPDFGASDSRWSYGPVHRVDLLRGLGRRSRLEHVVSVMNRAATQDLRAVRDWPVIRAIIGAGAPDERTGRAAQLVDDWIAAGASRLDADGDGRIDAAGAAVLDAAWPRLADAVLAPVLGPQLGRFAEIARRDDKPTGLGSAFDSGWYGYVDKDLRALLGRPVKGRYSRGYCGAGNLDACRAALWAALQAASDALAVAQGPDPAAWRADADGERIKFEPGLLGDFTMRWTNRPTFQQVIEFGGHRPR